MPDITGHKISQVPPTAPVAGRTDAQGSPRAPDMPGEDIAAGQTGDVQPGKRALLAAVARRALAIQRSATALRKAIATLAQMDAAVVFALDAAGEATAARSLPDSAVDALQHQLDLAINGIDCMASQASFGEAPLFDGAFSVEIEGRQLALPRISSHHLGGGTVPMAMSWGTCETAVQYSQSIASAASGGPNSLLVCAGGAVDALASGLAKLRRVKEALSAFQEEMIRPKAGELAVALANALASESRVDSLDQVTKMLSDVRRNMQDDLSQGSGMQRPGGVLHLLG